MIGTIPNYVPKCVPKKWAIKSEIQPRSNRHRFDTKNKDFDQQSLLHSTRRKSTILLLAALNDILKTP